MNDVYQDYLAHYGVKGQKWGVRRYQNEDGSLTSEGKSHYGEDGQPSEKKVKNGEDKKPQKNQGALYRHMFNEKETYWSKNGEDPYEKANKKVIQGIKAQMAGIGLTSLSYVMARHSDTKNKKLASILAYYGGQTLWAYGMGKTLYNRQKRAKYAWYSKSKPRKGEPGYEGK